MRLATAAWQSGMLAGFCVGAAAMQIAANIWTDGAFLDPYTALFAILVGLIVYPLTIRAAIRERSPDHAS